MKHSDLNKLWTNYREDHRKWQTELGQQAALLAKTVSERLEPTNTEWTEPSKGIKHRYITDLDLSDKPSPIAFGTEYKSINDNGELVFAISVTLERAPESFPKAPLTVPVAARFREGKAEFAFYDRNSKAVGQPPNWETDIGTFADALIERIVKYLSFDPFQGPPKKSSIGFQ